MNWPLVIMQFLIGCGLLVWGADRFIVASSSLARRMGMSTLMVGVLLVGFGTSFPEIVVSAIASIHGTPQMAIGNAVGSNIINIGLVLGLSALIFPLTVHSKLLKREFPILLVVSLFVFILISNHYLSRIDGILLIVVLLLHLYWMFFMVPKLEKNHDALAIEFAKELPKHPMQLWVAIAWWLFGLALLFLSSELIVDGAVQIAKWLHISDLIIGLTVVALGTSLPELAATVMSAMKKEHDIAVGNVIGSNIFNLLAVMAMPALISPTKLPSSLIWRDYPVMLGFIITMWLFAFFPRKKPVLGRFGGTIMLLGFTVYLVWIVRSTLMS